VVDFWTSVLGQLKKKPELSHAMKKSLHLNESKMDPRSKSGSFGISRRIWTKVGLGNESITNPRSKLEVRAAQEDAEDPAEGSTDHTSRNDLPATSNHQPLDHHISPSILNCFAAKAGMTLICTFGRGISYGPLLTRQALESNFSIFFRIGAEAWV
jgi:hypothetical protein